LTFLGAEEPSVNTLPPSDYQLELSESERAWIQAHPTIRIGVDPEFAPYEFISEEGEFSGIASDYVMLLNERLGLNMQMVPGLTWQQAVTRAEYREIDLLSAVGITEDRKKFLIFSDAYVKFDRVIIARDDAPFVSGIDDIRTWRVAVQADTSHEGYLRDRTDISPVIYQTHEELVMAVSDGEVDAMIGNIGSTTYLIRKLNVTNLRVVAPVSTQKQQLHIAVRDDWPILVGIINKGLASISPAEKNRIQQRWFSIDYMVGVPKRQVLVYVIQVTAVALVLLAVFVAWNYRLRQEISRRKQAVADLGHSENRYRTLFDSSPDAVVVTDESGFLDCNAAALELYRCPSVEAFRKLPPGAVSTPTQADGLDSVELKNEMIRRAQTEGTHCFEWNSRRLDGTEFKAEVTLSSLEIEGRRITQALVRDVTERLKAEKQIRYLANHDALTGLPSLRIYQDRLSTALARAEREKALLAVLFVDLDGFKAINDNEGHAAGDQVLRTVAERLTDCMRKADTVARTGGDEFVMLLPVTDGEVGAVTTAKKVIEAVNLPIRFEGRALQVGASIGIALFPAHAITTEGLMRNADRAMHLAKAAGKNTIDVAPLESADGEPGEISET
jgi:diguanylate cyclase (GGDEF)-like protein